MKRSWRNSARWRTLPASLTASMPGGCISSWISSSTIPPTSTAGSGLPLRIPLPSTAITISSGMGRREMNLRTTGSHFSQGLPGTIIRNRNSGLSTFFPKSRWISTGTVRMSAPTSPPWWTAGWTGASTASAWTSSITFPKNPDFRRGTVPSGTWSATPASNGIFTDLIFTNTCTNSTRRPLRPIMLFPSAKRRGSEWKWARWWPAKNGRN